MAKFKLAALLLLSLTSTVRDACAKIIVNLPAPAPQYDINATGDFNLYQAGGQDPIPTPGYVDTDRKFRYIWTQAGAAIADAGNLIYIDIFTNDTFTVPSGGRLIVMLSHGNTQGSEIPIQRAGVREDKTPLISPATCADSAGQACQSADTDGRFYAAEIKPNTWYRLGFSLVDLCLKATTSGTTTICNGANGSNYTGLNGAMFSETITVNIAAVKNNFQANARIILPSDSNQTGLKTQAFTLHLSDLAPTVSCTGVTAEDQFYFPGDQQITLNIGNFTASTQGGPPLLNYIFLANRNSQPAVPPTGQTSSEVVDYIPTGGTTQIVNGNFVNTTTGSDNGYTPVVHAENSAGMISDVTPPNSCVPTGFTVRTQTISGVLTESKCFIATAAYHDGRAAPVMMLRKFRDRVLSRFEWGRKFIETYYEHSPAWAEWAWDKPVIRSLALKLLTPLELAAWVTLKLSGAEQVGQPPESGPEPYIERLRKVIPPGPSDTTSYTEEQKKSLDQIPENKKPTSSEDYTIKEREKLKVEEAGKEPESPEGYAERQKAALPPEQYRANPSELVKSGRDRKLGYGDVPPIKNAFSIRFGISPGMEVSVAGASASRSFSNIYGDGWKPELLLHFERQLFHSENFGSFGLTADTGISYAEGFGQLQFAFAGSTESQTRFSFVQVPVLLGANYRFNFFRLFRPYVGAGVGTMLYSEIRNDQRSSPRGYSFIYDTHVGLSFLMDFLDPNTARDSYLTQGVQHTFLFAEYFYLNTLGSSVVFNRSGVYAGFLFEI